jgi:N-acetylglucosamine malate deacetylase 1
MSPAGADRILVLAPHPDDEIVACGIAALRARAAGARVFVLHLTTGVPRHGRDYEARVRRRHDEALAAARLLGLEPAGFRATPARRLRLDLECAARDVEAAIAQCGADALWVPAFEGAHQDHDAANALGFAVASKLPVWEFAAYNFAGGRVRANRFAAPRGGESALEAAPDEARRKAEALACYASERGNLRHIGAAYEECRPLPAHDYGAPPHPGRLFRERFHWVPFRHPRVDFEPSATVYRDLAAWVSGRQAGRPAVLGDCPGEQPGQAGREFAGALDEPQRQRAVGR